MKWLIMIFLFSHAALAHQTIVVNQAMPSLDEQAHANPDVALYHPALPGMNRYLHPNGKRSEHLYVDGAGNFFERFEFHPLQGCARQLLQRIVPGADGKPDGEYRALAAETRRELSLTAH